MHVCSYGEMEPNFPKYYPSYNKHYTCCYSIAFYEEYKHDQTNTGIQNSIHCMKTLLFLKLNTNDLIHARRWNNRFCAI